MGKWGCGRVVLIFVDILRFTNPETKPTSHGCSNWCVTILGPLRMPSYSLTGDMALRNSQAPPLFWVCFTGFGLVGSKPLSTAGCVANFALSSMFSARQLATHHACHLTSSWCRASMGGRNQRRFVVDCRWDGE